MWPDPDAERQPAEDLGLSEGLQAQTLDHHESILGVYAQAETATPTVLTDAGAGTALETTSASTATPGSAATSTDAAATDSAGLAGLGLGALGLSGAVGLGVVALAAGGSKGTQPTNAAPSALALTGALQGSGKNEIAENTSTTSRTKVADIAITDDGLGTNTLSLSGADKDLFEIVGNALYLKAGTALDYETKHSYAVTVQVQDSTVSGSAALSQNLEIKLTDVDEVAPTALLKAEALANNGNAVVQSSEVGTAYLVKNTHTVGSLADIIGADDNVWSSVAVGAANTDTNLSVSGLLAGVYKLYTTDAAGNLSTVASDTVVVSNTSTTAMSLNAGTPDTDYGKLIAPVYVDKNWYFAWDLNGDGVHSSTQDATGKFDANGGVVNVTGNGYQYDTMAHDVLDGFFRYDIAGNLETSSNAVGTVGDTDNTFRFGALNAVKLALPTIGNGETTATTFAYAAGTTIDNNPAGEFNPTYDDLLAIWDSYNGSGAGTEVGGTPTGWNSYTYLSATPSQDGHAELFFNSGYVSYSGEDYIGSIATLQVL